MHDQLPFFNGEKKTWLYSWFELEGAEGLFGMGLEYLGLGFWCF